ADVFAAVSLADETFAELASPAVQVRTGDGTVVWGDVALAASATVAEGDLDALVVTPSGHLAADLDDGPVPFVRATRTADGWELVEVGGSSRDAGSDLSAVLDRWVCGSDEIVAETVTIRRAF